MTITATEFKTNFGKYMDLVREEDIIVTKNGKTIGVFSNPDVDPVEGLSGMLKGCKPIDQKQLREERIKERYGEYL